MNCCAYWSAPFPCWEETCWQSLGCRSPLPPGSPWASPWGVNRLDDGCDRAQRRWKAPLFFRERTNKFNQPAKRVFCCPGREGVPGSAQNPWAHGGRSEARGHSCKTEAICLTLTQYHGRHTWEFGTTSNTDVMLKFWLSVSLEHSTFTSQEAGREQLSPYPGLPHCQQHSDQYSSSGPKPLHPPEPLIWPSKLAHLPWSQGCLLSPATDQPALVCLWAGRPTHWEKDTGDLDPTAAKLQELTYPVWLSPGCGSCCLPKRNFELHLIPGRRWTVASQSHPRGLLERY